jgi:hypothetical protein
MNMARQRGMTIVGWLVIAVVGAGTVTLALRLGPHYIDFRTIQAVVESLPASEVHLMTTANIRELLEKRLKINNVRDKSMKDLMKIERTKEETHVKVDYEVREPLIYNADVVLVFRADYGFD